MMRSTGSKERFAPSALLTVICGHGINAARAFSARPGSISIAVIFPVRPDEFGHECSIIAGAAAEMQGLLADGNVELVEQKGP
jgi:hypothetical protein